MTVQSTKRIDDAIKQAIEDARRPLNDFEIHKILRWQYKLEGKVLLFSDYQQQRRWLLTMGKIVIAEESDKGEAFSTYTLP